MQMQTQSSHRCGIDRREMEMFFNSCLTMFPRGVLGDVRRRVGVVLKGGPEDLGNRKEGETARSL